MAETGMPAALSIWTSFLLRQAALRVQDRVAEALVTIGLRPPHNSVLTLLMAGPQSQVALGAQLHTDRTTMVTIIDELEQWGLVVRQRNPHDRRIHDVTLTEAGNTMVARAHMVLEQADAAFFAALAPAEREQFRAFLWRLIQTHDHLQKGPDHAANPDHP